MTNATRLLTLLPFAALLGGCPIFIDDHDHDGQWYCDDRGCWDGDGRPQWCDRDVDCPHGSVCDEDSGRCVDAPNCDYDHPCPLEYQCDFAQQVCVPPVNDVSCESSDDCLGGSYCLDGECVDSGMCSDDDDCADVGENLVCDPERSTCIPDPGPCPTGECGCVVDADCDGGFVCEEGACWDPASLCEVDLECGEGRVCDGAFCAKSCAGDGVCPTGQACGADLVCRDIVGGVGECVYSSECADDEQCINATCFTSCGDDDACGSFEYCDHGACRADDRPTQ
jgi:hypothetical protein